MKPPAWMKVQSELGHTPIVEGVVAGSTPVLMQRYLYQSIERTVTGMELVAMVTQFGGGGVREGEVGQWRSRNLPSQSLLIPSGVATHWHYSGTVDFAVFYFLDGAAAELKPLINLASSRTAPLPFADQLVSAAGLQLVTEAQKGRHADQRFMERLTAVMLEQAFRVLTTPGTVGINPRHTHYSRLQAVLNYVHEHLTEDLRAETLATRADLSLAHFRRIFEEAMGVPPHRYIVGVRLEQARKLLTLSNMPISRLAQECGFSSQSHLTACFREAHATTPAQFRAAMTIGKGKPKR